MLSVPFAVRLILAITVVLNMGCAKSIQANILPQHGSEVELSHIYVVRPSPFAYAVNQRVYMDNVIAGQVGPRGFIGWGVKPGPTLLHGPWGFVKVLAEPGKTYYFKLKGRTFGFGNRAFKLVSIPEAQGKPYLEKLKPPKVNIVAQPS